MVKIQTEGEFLHAAKQKAQLIVARPKACLKQTRHFAYQAIAIQIR